MTASIVHASPTVALVPTDRPPLPRLRGSSPCLRRSASLSFPPDGVRGIGGGAAATRASLIRGGRRGGPGSSSPDPVALQIASAESPDGPPQSCERRDLPVCPE